MTYLRGLRQALGVWRVAKLSEFPVMLRASLGEGGSFAAGFEPGNPQVRDAQVTHIRQRISVFANSCDLFTMQSYRTHALQ